MNSSLPINIRNLQTLAIEKYEVVSNSSPLIINEIFKSREQLNTTYGIKIFSKYLYQILYIILQKQFHSWKLKFGDFFL